ncbi:MAG: hypothetical protein ACOY3Z_03875 [Thermodesulfobacteriota bacterium]
MTSATGQIYRITSFDRFKDEFLAKALGFVTYDTWMDPSEGPILRALDLDEGRKKILSWLGKHSKTDLPPQVLLEILTNLRKTVHMQSWSYNPESNLMWGAYSHQGRAIRISTTKESISQIGGVKIVRMDYKVLPLKHELRRVFKKGKLHLDEVFARKKPEYRDEKELRLITDIDLAWLEKATLPWGVPPSAIRASCQGIVEQGAMTPDDLEKTVASWILKACVKPVSFGHVNGFIESVLVGPTATPEFVSEVEMFCAENDLHFKGKSEVLTYKLPKD